MSVTRAGTVYKQNSGMENRNGTTSENRGVVEELSSGRGELASGGVAAVLQMFMEER